MGEDTEPREPEIGDIVEVPHVRGADFRRVYADGCAFHNDVGLQANVLLTFYIDSNNVDADVFAMTENGFQPAGMKSSLLREDVVAVTLPKGVAIQLAALINRHMLQEDEE